MTLNPEVHGLNLPTDTEIHFDVQWPAKIDQVDVPKESRSTARVRLEVKVKAGTRFRLGVGNVGFSINSLTSQTGYISSFMSLQFCLLRTNGNKDKRYLLHN